MWHKQGSKDYKLSSQHGTDQRYDAHRHVSHSTNCSPSAGITRETNAESEDCRGFSCFEDFYCGGLWSELLSATVLKSSLFCNINADLRGGDQNKHMLKEQQQRVCTWGNVKSVTQIRDEILYRTLPACSEWFRLIIYDPRTSREMSGTQQSLVGRWSNCLFHQFPEDKTKWATERNPSKTAAPPSVSQLPSSSAAYLCVSSQTRC